MQHDINCFLGKYFMYFWRTVRSSMFSTVIGLLDKVAHPRGPLPSTSKPPWLRIIWLPGQKEQSMPGSHGGTAF